ncbi:LCP family protein [Boudabousia marimammalium]|uniref:Cell envelope-related transcriptional attenuator domain-containing protein n=1 Tax=Boudabousia marimammalium TaxID=156892 RepID=A0A1Q5PRM7_9ACTO|nr:LCP family protein [Boudabousia marimammalium]OKL50237.1 hypothetical protein BM477_02255 [Boudabousia marimammalium]
MQYLKPRQRKRIVRHSDTNRKSFRWGRALLLVIFAFILATSTVLAYKYVQLHWALQKGIIDNSRLIDQPTSTIEIPSDSYEGRAVNILLMGRDNIDENGRVRPGDSGMGMRNDTTIIMHISKDRKRVELISIPRDALVKLPSCRRSDGSTAPAERGMFNSAFARGGAHGDIGSAAACAINTVQSISGIHIDDFVVVDFAGFRGMVDALGGVEMCFDKRYADPHYTGLDVGPGCVKMDGLKATNYARARHLTNTDGSDVSRIGRQQRLLGELISTALQKGLWVQADFAQQALENSNMSPRLGSVPTLLGLATSLSSINPEQVVFTTAPWTEAPSDRNRVVLTRQAEKIWEALQEDQPLPDGIERKDVLGNIRSTQTPEQPAKAPSTESN